MAKRIVKETLANGKCNYRVETNDGLFGLRKRFGWWKTCEIPIPNDTYCLAVFDSLTDAENYIDSLSEYVVSKEVIATYN